jgi:hypothetical protein
MSDDTSSSDDVNDAPAEPRKRKGKRKRARAGAGDASARRSLLDENGRERPRFVLAFPSDPALDELVRAFEKGDYARVRREAPLLAERSTDPDVRTAALELRRRLDPDPLFKYLLAVGFALLVFLTLYVYSTKSH